MKYKVLSLFSGVGGLDTGLAMTGNYEIVLANDVKPSMVEAYSSNFKADKSTFIDVDALPQVILNDVSTLDFTFLRNQCIDVVVGGPPCQDFSVLRSSSKERSGILVRRGRLYTHFVRALVSLQPSAFLFENVPGLVTSNKGEAYNAITKDLSHSHLRWNEIKKSLETDNSNSSKIQGYHLLLNKVVKASDFGVPQGRRRLIIIGLRKDLCNSRHPLHLASEFQSHIQRCKTFKKYPLTTVEAFEGKTLPETQETYQQVMNDYNGVWNEVKTPKAIRWKEKIWDKLTFDPVTDYLWLNNISNSNESELLQAFEEHENVLKELGYHGVDSAKLKMANSSNSPPKEDTDIVEKLEKIPPDENFLFVKDSRWQIREKGVSQIYRRLHPLKPSYTVVAFGGGGMAMYHYKRSRSVLANREKARLQTFPDHYTFTGKYTTVKAQLGEAVPPLLAKRLGEALATMLETYRD